MVRGLGLGLGFGLELGLELRVCCLLFWTEFHVVRYMPGKVMNEGAKLYHMTALSVAGSTS